MFTAGCSYATISKQFGCSKSTVAYWVKKEREAGSVERVKGRGTKRKTSDNQDAEMVQTHDEEPFTPPKLTADQFHISSQTVRRRLKYGGLECHRPYVGQVLKPEHIEARLRWGINKRRWYGPQWEQVLFSDESRFNFHFHDGRVKIWRRRGKRFDPKCIKEVDRCGGGSVMIWAGITAEHRTELTIFDGNVNAAVYVNDVLLPRVVPFFRTHRDIVLFQQDNARPHTANLSKACLEHHRIALLDWPAKSPDMSPIEHLWDELGRRVRKRNILNVRELRQALIEEYNAIDQHIIANLIASMRRRVSSLIDARGGHTHY